MKLSSYIPYPFRVAWQIVMSVPLALALVAMLLILFLGWGGDAALAFVKTWDDLVIRIGGDDDEDERDYD